jgi:integrase/recombinase XerD
MDPLLHTWSQSLAASGMSPNTIRSYTGSVDRLSRRAGVRPADLGPDEIAEYLASYPGQATRSQYYKALRAWSVWLKATKRGGGKRMLAGVRRPKVPERQPDPITTEQLLLLTSSVSCPRMRGMVLLAAFAGLRVHEIAKFNGRDLRADGLHVVGKGGKSARLPAHPLILDHAEQMPSGLWFPSRSDPSKPRPAVSVGNSMSREMRRAGIPGGHPHQLRAWYATQLVRAGVPLTTVRILMRHSNISTTQAYVAVGEDECAAAVLRLAA